MRAHRLTRLVLVVAVWGACALASTAPAGSASAIVPPPGTPDLSRMVLQQSDFAPVALVTAQGYARADRELGEIADYQRTLVGSTAASGAKFAGAFSDVLLLGESFAAKLYLAEERDIFRSPRFQRRFAREIDTAVRRRERTRPRGIHFGAIRGLRVGDESILQPVSARVRGVPYSYDRIALRVDCAVGSLELRAVPGGRISFGEARGLAGTMADRMRTGLRMAAPVILVAPTTEVIPNILVPPKIPAPPKVIGSRVIQVTAAPGQTLDASEGTWLGCPQSVTYQWERCDAMGAHCAAVGAAVADVTGRLYRLTAGDAGMRLRVSVTATNAVGTSAPTTSAPTAVIRRRKSGS